MASSPTLAGSPTQEHSASPDAAPRFLLCVPSMPAGTLPVFLADVASVFRPEEILVASPDIQEPDEAYPIRMTLVEGMRVRSDWVLTVSDFIAANELLQQHNAMFAILLGSDASSLSPSVLRQFADQLGGGTDLLLPAYSLGPHDGLVASALLYPLTRALFSANIRFPLPLDAGMSRRMLERMSTVAHRHVASQPDALLWPVSEAAAASFTARQIEAAAAVPSAPPNADFNALFAGVAGSLFADIEAKAQIWQRSRGPSAAATSRDQLQPGAVNDSGEIDEELTAMVDSYRLAHKNLQEIWSLALPPQTLLMLKKLSLAEPAAFIMAPALWARIVYDFALAFHLRTLNRGHLMGAFTPLYLAWVASTLRTVSDDATAAAHREETAAAFEREKPYLVARWRWPDRFNP